MLYFFYFALLIYPNSNIYSQDNCIKTIYVEEHTEQFIASFPFPRITKEIQKKHIEIECSLYKQINIGDKLYSEQVKEFVYETSDKPTFVLPHGKMKKKSYVVLNK